MTHTVFDELFAHDAQPSPYIDHEETTQLASDSFAFDDVFSSDKHVVSITKSPKQYVYMFALADSEVLLNYYKHKLLKQTPNAQWLFTGTYRYDATYTYSDGSTEIITETKKARKRK